MNVIANINKELNKPEFFPRLIALVLSTLLIGYAPSSIALGVLSFFSLWYAIASKRKLKLQFELLIPISIYVLFVLTLFWTINVNLTIKGLERTISLCVVPIIFLILPKFNFDRTKLVLEYFTKANLAYGLFFLSVALVNFIKTKSFVVFTYHDLVSILDLNAIYVSIYFLICLTYLLSKTNKNKLDIFSIVFFIILLILLSSKMILFILVIVLVVYGLYFKPFSYFKNIKLVFIAILVTLVVILISSRVINRLFEEKTTNIQEILYKEKFNKIYPWTGTSIRLLQLRILHEQIEEESIFWKGFGLFASRDNLKKRHLKFNTYFGYHTYNYHNQYAQIFSEAGVFGLLLLVLMLYYNFRKALKTKNFLFISFAIIIPFVFLTESFLWVQRGIIFFTVFYCLLNRTDFNSKKKDNNKVKFFSK